MFIKHYAPNRCLCIEPIQLITGLRIAEMSRRQGEGGYVQRIEVIEKRKKVRVGVRVDVNGEVKLLWKFKKKFFWVGGGGGGGGGRVEGGSGWM